MADRFGRAIPLDLAIVLGITALTVGSILVPGAKEAGVRTILGFVFVLFVPGYAVAAALFPERSEVGTRIEESDETTALVSTDITKLERAGISIGLSLSIVPLVGFGLTFTPFGIRLLPVLGVTTVITIVAVAVAGYRRAQLPTERRFQWDVLNWVGWLGLRDSDGGSRFQRLLNLTLLMSILLATSTVGFSVAFPRNDERFTEFYLLSETENGTLVAQDFPSSLTDGDEATVHVGIHNREETRMDYTVVVELQRTVRDGESIEVVESREVGRRTASLRHNESWLREFSLRPAMTGERLRLVFLLFRGEPPAEPSTENAYRSTHLWVDVPSQGAAQQSLTADRREGALPDGAEVRLTHPEAGTYR